MWGGRFAEGPSAIMREINASIPVDKALWRQDIAASKAHVAMLGAQAGEVMTAVQLAMLGGLPYTALRDGILAHPTLAEGLNMLFAEVRAVQ